MNVKHKLSEALRTRGAKRNALIVFVAWCAIFAIWYFRRPLPLDRQAEQLLNAMLAADGKTMMRYAFPEEIKANELTAARLDRVYRELVLPRINKLSNRTMVSAEDRVTNGFAGFDARTATGRTVGFGTSVYMHDAGAKTSVLESLYSAWIAEYMGEHDESFDLQVRNKAVLAGVQHDVTRLRAIGISHLPSYNLYTGEIRMIDLDTFEQGYELWVAHPELRPQSSE